MSTNRLCDEIRDLLAEHATGELDAPRAARVEEHLATCAACRADAAGYREVVALLAGDAGAAGEGMGGGIPDPGARYWDRFAGRVRTRIAAEGMRAGDARVRRPRGLRAWLVAPRLALAAAVLLLAFLGLRGASFFGVPDGDDETLSAALASLDPAQIPDEVGQLSPDEADRFEDELLAAAPAAPKKARATQTPAPTPAPKATHAPASATSGAAKGAPSGDGDGGDAFDAAAPGELQDDITGLDDLSPEELDQLLERLDAMKT